MQLFNHLPIVDTEYFLLNFKNRQSYDQFRNSKKYL